LGNINIREAILDDVPQMAFLWQKLMKFHDGHNPLFQAREDSYKTVPEMLSKRIQSENQFALVAEKEKEMVGMIMFRIEDLPPTLPFKKRGYIAETYIEDNYRDNGLGEAMVQRVLTFFKSEKCGISELQVSVQNQRGLEFWQRMGFVEGTIHMMRKL
jgi:ribosomal protein S18 acetylase RimI-like enzyme